MYAGLRRGELRALRIEDVDLAAGVIRIERSWDDEEGSIAPKSAAGRRTVPIPGLLREHLVAHRLRQGRSDGLIFGVGRERHSARPRSGAGQPQLGVAPASPPSPCTKRAIPSDRSRSPPA